jgi:tetratricopeptide (TPR) repeat protein/predicted Ser/Thr protein kinase
MSADARDARLSNYRLERLLGSGGMGEVYLARDLALERPVAIKFITPGKEADAGARKRLIREARAAAALEHPNICGVHEVIVEPDGRACIVMQYVEGRTLADVLRGGPLDERLAMTIACDLASALAAAHKQGIIHRDVKPQNVIITADNRAKLLDFGLARPDQASGANPDGATQTEVSSPAFVLGTPAYMSPEQARQQPLDGRSDLFSLGAVLYECLTGTRAFHGKTPIELAADVLGSQPPPVSSVRPDLTPQHDELCRRLLAKHPADRFQSAEELLGALRVFTGDSSRGTSADGLRSAPWWGRRRALIAAAAAVVLLGLVAVSAWFWRIPAEPADADAARWYRRGTEAIRDGAYHSGRLALGEAIKTAPAFAPAYIRLAEAEAELGEAESAQQALLRADALVSTELRLPFSERKRIEAVRALMLRDVDDFVRAYSELVRRHPDDPGAWLDLGRAQDAAALSADARKSYEKAIQIDSQYAAAHLRRASILGLEGRRDEALAAFTEAERLYVASTNVEGEIETLIRRGAFLNSVLDLRGARAALERAESLAVQVGSRAQEIRAQLTLSSVTAAEGLWEDADKIAKAAVAAALREHLEAVAAEGLVDLATVAMLRGRRSEAEAHLAYAVQLAEKHGAARVAARATLQRAAMMLDEGHFAQAIETARRPLEYFQANRYRRYELNALNVMARGHELLGRYAEARALAEDALTKATTINDDGQIGEALENLGGQANAVGDLPQAAEFRRRSVELQRKLNNQTVLPFDLVNRADLLIRIGRHEEASQLLDEVEAGIAKKVDAYVGRARRVRILRAMSAAIVQKPDEVVRHLEAFPPGPDGTPDSTSHFAATLVQYARTLRGGTASTTAADAPLRGSTTAAGRGPRYWDLLSRLAGDPRRALAGVDATLAAPGATVSPEFEWRVAAIGAAAARRAGDAIRERELRDRATRALARLRQEWKDHAATYEARPDLAELKRRAGFND